MGVYKDKNRGNWYVSYRYVDSFGNRKRKYHRGFRTRADLEEALKENAEHLEKADIRKKLSQKYMDMELSKEQREVIEQLLYFSGEKEVQYGDCAYKTGFRDCITIMKALHILD